jgi:hypothetical protein
VRRVIGMVVLFRRRRSRYPLMRDVGEILNGDDWDDGGEENKGEAD